MKSGGRGGGRAAAVKSNPAASGKGGGGGGGMGSTHGAGASSSALRYFLDHIPVTAVSGLHHSSLPVVEVNFDDSVEHAIKLLYENNLSRAPIVDSAAISHFRKSMDRDIGFIELSNMVLWSLEEIARVKGESQGSNLGLFDVLANNSQVGQTKVIDLAKSFIWEPFFPAHDNETLFHLLLLFSKHHRLNVIPVIRSCDSSIIGFITQNAVTRFLLQSSGLEWFDGVADKSLSEYGLINPAGDVSIYSDQSLEYALHILWIKELYQVPVLDRMSGMLTGCVRRSDIYFLLDDDSLFSNRKVFTVEDFIKFLEAENDRRSRRSTKMELSTAGLPKLENKIHPQKQNPVILQKSDSLKKAMESMVASSSESGFLISDSAKLEGMVTLRDILHPFSPPLTDSRMDGGGFFKSLLNQAGCHVHDGVMIRNS